VGEDVFADWKTQRFIIAGGYAEKYLDQYPNGHLIVLTDFKFWTEHAEELVAWCKQHACQVEGMTVTVPDDKKLTLFALKWS